MVRPVQARINPVDPIQARSGPTSPVQHGWFNPVNQSNPLGVDRPSKPPVTLAATVVALQPLHPGCPSSILQSPFKYADNIGLYLLVVSICQIWH